MHLLAEQRRHDFSVWIRTGRWPRRGDSRAIERKFNPWHDPANGRFTFAGAGGYSGTGGARQADGGGQDTRKVAYIEDRALPPIASRKEVEAWRAEELAKHGHEPGYPKAIEAQYRRYLDELARRDHPASEIQAAGQAGGGSSAPESVPVPAKGQARVPDTGKTAAYGRARPEVRATPTLFPRREALPPARDGFGGGGGSSGGSDASGSSGPSATQPSASARSSARSGFGGGGGSFGGGGASGSWDSAATQSGPSTPASSATSKPHHVLPGAIRHASAANAQRHTVVRNGYTYELDADGAVRRASGTLSSTDTPKRSRTNQAKAGGADRRPSDDGGHYIAARFNGPTDAFNHFAQDANFNRGRYRALEDQWARAQRARRKVMVDIAPHYHDGSRRPYELDITFTVDGRKESIKLPNERTEKANGK